MTRLAVQILWPAFLMAGVFEVLLFAVIDPSDLHWFGAPLELSRQAVYTLAFFVFWAVALVASALTLLLSLSAGELNRRSGD